jgi:hypothetical protein
VLGRVVGLLGVDGRVLGLVGVVGRVLGLLGVDGRVVGLLGVDGRVLGLVGTDGRVLGLVAPPGRVEGRVPGLFWLVTGRRLPSARLGRFMSFHFPLFLFDQLPFSSRLTIFPSLPT